MNSSAIRVLVLILALSLCVSPAAWADEEGGPRNPSTATDIGLGVASFLVSVPYGTAKVVTAVLGGIVGGFTYLFSGFNKKAADQVWYTTIPGDYVITPDQLRGKRDIRFTGVPPETVR